jgi:hypothetical protein
LWLAYIFFFGFIEPFRKEPTAPSTKPTIISKSGMGLQGELFIIGRMPGLFKYLKPYCQLFLDKSKIYAKKRNIFICIAT